MHVLLTHATQHKLHLDRFSRFRATICENGSPYAIEPLSVCPVCLSVTLVYCGQTVGWIRMPLGTEVGLGPGHIVLDKEPAPPPPKGAHTSIFGPCLLWPNGWMDQDATWYGGRPRPRRRCVRRWPSSPNGKGHSSLHFLVHLSN